ncbi:subtilisin-like protein [Penicillium canariense]|uniref:Subtilisin-like protein n=1 Tax=Penicillium canariense TaxID=189055 RepID=A0A9W9IHW6_9EURO|nr:subtilisin-like protein [Penicillium canariense]KAJ5174596.1 subtilisin-like protein [Penicillium canariense]
MATEDPLDFAHAAIVQVANIASSLGGESKRPVCGRLGAELFLVADYIDTAGLDQEKRVRLRIPKLLRDVEAICNARTKIRRGLGQLTTHSRDAEEVIAHIQKFTKCDRKSSKRDESDTITSTKRFTRPERSRHANELFYLTLREQMCCTCQSNGMREHMESKHLVRLLLQPPAQQATSNSLVQFDMLFSSTPFWNESQLSYWQDVELLVPSNNHTSNKKRPRFADTDGQYTHANIMAAKQMRQVGQGLFCSLIGQGANWRICLSIQEGGLQHCFEPLKQRVDHVPGISLAKILRSYHLTARMKVVLAYIIAYSVWQYYDSDWMKTKWTSETIQFMRESNTSADQGKLFTWKPYLSIHLNDEDSQCYEYSKIAGMVHDYPRIRALGIMLVEIGTGFPLHKDEQQAQPSAAKVNNELFTAISYTQDEKRWRDFDYPDYMSAARHYLAPDTFDQVPYVEESSACEWRQGIKQRRNILYDKVVFPLEDLLQGTKWMEDYTNIAPLDMPSKATTMQETPVAPEGFEQDKMPKPKKKRSKSEKDASKWLSRLRGFNMELAQVARRVGLNDVSRRVRIAILDTGYDDNAPIFFSSGVEGRLKGWKDWVDGSGQPEDCHGHGTHLVALVLKCAPEADIYVARIAKSPIELLDSSENVAKAISWASREWEADIISMSFGFADEQPCISGAIREAQYERKDAILFFAAASNYGANDREMFPARHDSVISIRGTNANGDFEDFNPPKHEDESAVFGTLGLDVPSAWSNSDDEVYKSGTSIATAIAAGIAGCLLGYISSHPPERPFYNAKYRAWTRQGMHAIFRVLSSNTLKAGYLYLTVWDLIGKAEDVRWAKLGGALSEL